MLKKLAKYNAGRPGLVVALAAVIVLANIGQVASQQQGTAKTKASQAEKASPDKHLEFEQQENAGGEELMIVDLAL